MEATYTKSLIFKEVDGEVEMRQSNALYKAKKNEVVKLFEDMKALRAFIPCDKKASIVDGDVVWIDLSDDDISKSIKRDIDKRKAEIRKELKSFDDYIIKCYADGLDFKSKYPYLAEARDKLLTELNSI